MKVSVIIPCYNLGDYLGDAIESVKAQTFTDYEIIVVDDGSTDKNTKEAITNFKKAYTNIKFLSQRNAGPAAARNTGINESKGDYIICLDADDLLAADYIEKTVCELDKDSSDKLGFVTTWLKEFGERDNLWKTSDFDIPKMLAGNTVHAGSIFRKEAWEKAGGYNEKRQLQGYEDWDFWLRIIEKGYSWSVIPEALFHYRIRPNSLLTTAKSEHIKKYTLLLDLHKDLFMKYSRALILETADELASTHRAIAEKDKTIDELESYKNEVLSLREQLFYTRDELYNLKNSRVLGRVIKARNKVGSARHFAKSLPHSTRVKVAPFVPAPARRAIKATVRKGLGRGEHIKATNVIVNNEPWDEKLPLVSVVIPYFNREDTIDETLESLDGQSFTNFETILVNDGSTKTKSIKKLDDIGRLRPNIKIFNQKNSGVAAARNNGIKHSRGKYIICLDSDDILETTFIEKCTLVLETDPDTSFVTTHRNDFGMVNEPYQNNQFDAVELYINNMVITAAEFRRSAWEKVKGYKSGIGYEDWEFWVNLSEHGFWGKLIPEHLFKYRTSMQSRFIADKDAHWKTIKEIRDLHPVYKKTVSEVLNKRRAVNHVVEPVEAFINLNSNRYYYQPTNEKKNILLAIPWMTFGGAETLILNFCNELQNDFNLSFVTGLPSDHEWEYKFKDLTPNVYHLEKLFKDEALYVEFVSNYIKTRNIDALHIIHTSAFFGMLPELQKRHPDLKIVVTVFNDIAEHFTRSVEREDYIDAFSTDNTSVAKHYQQELKDNKAVTVIPNGINCYDTYNPALFDGKKQRQELGLDDGDLSVFFVGRLSEEKNPDVFIETAAKLLQTHKTGLRFFIIGDGPMKKQVEEALKKLNSKKITYLGYQSDIAKYLSAADIFVLPSSIEGFPLSILEAMAMKVVVIASDVGAVSDVVDSEVNGFVVNAGSVDEITHKIDYLKKHPDKLKEIKSAARDKVEANYSNVLLGKNYRKLYEGLIK